MVTTSVRPLRASATSRGSATPAHGYDPRGGCEREVANRFASRHLAKERQLALPYLGLCRGNSRVRGYPRDGLLSFFHGPSHIGHQSFEIVLCSLELCPLRLHFVSPFVLEGNGPAQYLGQNEQSVKARQWGPQCWMPSGNSLGRNT